LPGAVAQRGQAAASATRRPVAHERRFLGAPRVPGPRTPWMPAVRSVCRVWPRLTGLCGDDCIVARLHHPPAPCIAVHCSAMIASAMHAMSATMQRPTPVLPHEVGGAGTICVCGADARGQRAPVRTYVGNFPGWRRASADFRRCAPPSADYPQMRAGGARVPQEGGVVGREWHHVAPTMELNAH
jgi:hypothetical protein